MRKKKEREKFINVLIGLQSESDENRQGWGEQGCAQGVGSRVGNLASICFVVYVLLILLLNEKRERERKNIKSLHLY